MKSYKLEGNHKGIEYVTTVTLNFTMERHLGGKKRHLVVTKLADGTVFTDTAETEELKKTILKHRNDVIIWSQPVTSEEEHLLQELGFKPVDKDLKT
jgi:hypothetical protein